MVRQPYLKKGTWSRDEDQKLVAYIVRYGIWNWNEMPKYAGILDISFEAFNLNIVKIL